MVSFTQKDNYGFQDLLTIMSILRSEEGCPWDREQDHDSLRKNMIEEAYEAAQAIDQKDAAALCEELGDVLLQVVFHSQIAKEAGEFTIDDVADGICKKLVIRHPHVFADITVSGSADVLTNWNKIKRKEKEQHTHADAIDQVAKALPSLIRAQKVQSKAADAAFDFQNVDEAADKLEEEIGELREALNTQKKEPARLRDEVGDLLFSAVNVARLAGCDSEEALEGACDKFARRFRAIEQEALSLGKKLEEMSMSEKDKLWNRQKEWESK